MQAGERASSREQRGNNSESSGGASTSHRSGPAPNLNRKRSRAPGANRPRPHGVAALRTWPHSWRLRRKLAAVVVVPVSAVLIFAGLAIWTKGTSLSQLNALTAEVQLSQQAAAVGKALQRERDTAVVFAASDKSVGLEGYQQAAAATDAAHARLSTMITSAAGVSQGVRDAISTCQESLDALPEVRHSVQAALFPSSAANTQYDITIASIIQVVRAVAADAAPAGTTPQVAAQFLLAVEDVAQENSTMLMMAEQPASGSSPLAADLLGETEAYDSDYANFKSAASIDQRQQAIDALSAADVDQRAHLVEATLAQTSAGRPVTATVNALDSVGSATVAQYWQIEQTLLQQVQNTLGALRTATIHSLIAYVVVVAATVVLFVAVIVVVSSAMTTPLRTLRTSALAVARGLDARVHAILADPDPLTAADQAVEPISPHTAEEVGEVARSFDVVHSQALKLAAQHAALRDNINEIFVNLARRSQTLVERQLALIDQLERDEQDPDELANLFQLDHLATRMRRNSESLLVLSGRGLAKRMSQPVPIGDLVGAAISEVEQYARIEVGSAPDVHILGRVVNDLIHLIAELLDNATAFSEPNTKVSVRIAKIRSREVAIQITDRGIGMTEEDIHAANERLARPPDVDRAITKRMGLNVVARLAKHHNIRVKLRINEDIDGGTVALVLIGEDLISDTPISAGRAKPPAISSARPSLAPPEHGDGRVSTVAHQPSLHTPDGLGQHAGHTEAPAPPTQPHRTSDRSLWQPHIDPGPLSATEPDTAHHPSTNLAANTEDVAPVDGLGDDRVTERTPALQKVLNEWWFENEPQPVTSPADTPDGPGRTVEDSAAPSSGSTLAADAPPRSWVSPADDGWQAARIVFDGDKANPDDGLPRRVPGQYLIPGSAGTPAPSPSAAPRSAQSARMRLTDFQTGLRRGRRAAHEACARESTDTADVSQQRGHGAPTP